MSLSLLVPKRVAVLVIADSTVSVTVDVAVEQVMAEMEAVTISAARGPLVFGAAVQVDACRSFFDTRLKGTPAPEWIVKGIPAKDKGRDQPQQVVP